MMFLKMKIWKNGVEAISNCIGNGSICIVTSLLMNKFLKTIVIAPMTSSLKAYPTRVQINHQNRQGSIVLDQIRTVDRLRIVKVLGALNEKDTARVKKVLKETYVD